MATNIINRRDFLMRQALKTTIASICIYVGITTCSHAGAIDFVLQRCNDALNHTSRIEMMNELEEKTGIDSEANENIIILYAVMKNKKLSEKEKQILYNFEDMIKENPYINVKKSYDVLEGIDIVYEERPSEYQETVLGIYDAENNVVRIFLKDGKINFDILKHELVHAIFNYKKLLLLPDYFIEGVTELLVNEYFSDKPFVEENTYPYEVAAAKLLCDMVGSDKVLEAYTIGDMNIITTELSKTLGYKDSVELLGKIEILFDSFKESQRVSSKDLKEISDMIKKYITAKYEETEDEQILERFLYLKSLLENMTKENTYKNYWNYLEENGVYTKVYFSKRLKDKFPETIRINTDNSEYNGKSNQYKLTPTTN